MPGNYHTLNLGTNNIMVIPNGAFVTLNVTNLYLDYNNIRNISDFAFKGLATLRVLNLQHNRLLVLPDALRFFLGNINVLDISSNPIDGANHKKGGTVDGFADGVMKALGTYMYSRIP